MSSHFVWLALLSAQTPASANSAGVFLKAIYASDFFSHGVLLLIGLLSVCSWAVMLFKWLQFRRIRNQNEEFTAVWEQHSGDLTTIFEESAVLTRSPNAKVYAEGYRELKALARVVDQRPVIGRDTVVSIERAIDRVIAREIINMEQNIIVLATTANAAPLLGLLGTVWGILVVFWEIGMKQNATAATIAPGISAALITTVCGLLAAIPAVLGYNYFQNRTNEVVLEMEDFSSRFVSLLERNVSTHTRERSHTEAFTR